MYDNVAQHATSFSYRQRAIFSAHGRMASVAPSLKALRNRTVPKLSSRAVAEALEVPASTYAAYEDPKKFKKPILPFDLAKKLAAIFEQNGIDRSETLALAGITGELNAVSTMPRKADPDDDWVEVSGAVAAGRWLEQTAWAPSDRYDVKFGPPPYAGAKRFAVRMEGASMNRTIQDGADLECLWIKFQHLEPQPGDLVIVERKAHDLTEMTCKRLGRDADGWFICGESFDEQYNEPLRIGEPDPEAVTDDGIRVIGIVLSAKTDLARPGLSQRRYRFRT